MLNLLTGYGEETGAALARHPLVRKLSFTGSTEVGKLIMHAAADRIVPVSLELGGKSPAIVFPDADDARTVDGVISGMRVTRQGQSCTAGSRLFLHRSIFDSFLTKLPSKLQTLKIGDPTDEATDMGAIINRKQFDRVCGYIEDGLGSSEARVVLGGLPPATGPLAQGYFVQPTVFADVSNDWRIAREEIFGPVMVAIPWDDEREAIRMANDSHYGLAAYVWTHDIGKALSTAHAIESGWVQINQGLGQFSGPVLRRLQAERHRPRVLARRDARQLHAAEERHGQSPILNKATELTEKKNLCALCGLCGCSPDLDAFVRRKKQLLARHDGEGGVPRVQVATVAARYGPGACTSVMTRLRSTCSRYLVR